MMFALVLGLLAPVLTHDLDVDLAPQSAEAGEQAWDQEAGANAPGTCNVCHIFQHMALPAPQALLTLASMENAAFARSANARGLAHNPDGPPPRHRIT